MSDKVELTLCIIAIILVFFGAKAAYDVVRTALEITYIKKAKEEDKKKLTVI